MKLWQWDGRSTFGVVAGILLGWISAALFANPSPMS